MTTERTAPCNLEAERAVIGAILINNAAWYQVATLPASSFYRDAHRRIYRASVALCDAGTVADLVTVRDELERTDELEQVGGVAYLASMVDGVPHSTNVVHYAGIVREKAAQRRVIEIGNGMTARGYEETAAEVLAWADTQLLALTGSHVAGEPRTLATASMELARDLERRMENRGAVTGITTGFEGMDRQTLGWQRGDLIFVAARPSIGKTALVMNCATAAAKAGHRVLVFSMEMTAQQLEYRILSALSDVPLTRIFNGAVSPVEWPKITEALEAMHGLPVEVDDTPARTMLDVRAACRQMQSDRGLGLVVIDYVQLMRGSLERKGATRNDELTEISNRLKALARELQVPVLVLSQLTRASEKRDDPRPFMSDMRDCGAFEQDADIVVLLHRKNHREGGVTECIFAKQRNGSTGTVNLTLDRDCVRFVDGGEAPAEVAPAPKPVRAPKVNRW